MEEQNTSLTTQKGKKQRVHGASDQRQEGGPHSNSGNELGHGVATSGAPRLWQPPPILVGQRSPIILRPRIIHMVDSFKTPPTEEGPSDLTATTPPNCINGFSIGTDLHECFTPRASPLAPLVADPVHSPTEHRLLDDDTFPTELRVKVRCETLDLDPGLVRDESGVSGFVVSHFFHHVTGTPMFQVNFGGGIGCRFVRVSNTALELETTFDETQRTLFDEDVETTIDAVMVTLPALQVESDDDSEWQGEYADFQSQRESGDTRSDGCAACYTEDPLKELGMYNSEKDVSTWPFERVFADEQWQDQSITLL